MNIEEDLQRRFDAAGRSLDLEPGSLEAVKHEANRRTRNGRLLTSSAAVVLLLMLGSVAWLLLPDEDQTGELIESDSGPDTTAEPDDSRVTEDDFTYLGAFKLPAGMFGNSTFAYGGEVAAFNPTGDPENNDAFAGSMFVSGHPVNNPGIAEISIPAPSLHDGSTADLPVAKVLQQFADITDGRAFEYVGATNSGGQNHYFYGGLEVVDGAEGPRLHWSVWQDNNVTNNTVPAHGHSSTDLGNPDPQGPWFLADYNHRITPGYLFEVPEWFADSELGARNLMVGFKSGSTTTGRSWGPPFLAYSAPSTGEPGQQVDAILLALYDGENQALPGHNRADLTGGATWITTALGEEAVVTVGRRGLGEVHNGPAGPDDCNEYSGVHGGPYEPQVMFYSPNDLAQAASGDIEPWQLRPYRTWNPADYLTPTCEWVLSSISFDPAAGLVYVVQVQADVSQNEFDPVPVVHVFRV